jgi:hypothetical protein
VSGRIAAGAIAAALVLAACGSAGAPGVVSAACAGHPAITGIDRGRPATSVLALLGVLRRPATAADTLPSSLAGFAEQRAKVFTRSERRARVARARTYYLVPELTQSAAGCGPVQTIGMIITGPEGSSVQYGITPAHIASGTGFSYYGGAIPPTVIQLIVPDGVASVTVRYPAGKAGGFGRQSVPAATVTAAAVGNVVVIAAPRAGRKAITPASVTWRSPTGAVVRVMHAKI